MQTQVILSGLYAPTCVISHPINNVLYVTDQPGKIYRLIEGEEAELWLDLEPYLIPIIQGDESGLLSIVFSPDGKYLYVFSSRPLSSLSREDTLFSSRPDVITDKTFADLLTVIPIIDEEAIIEEEFTFFAILRQERVHHGGRLAITQKGELYISTGDGGPQKDPYNHAQDLGCILGKILRIIPLPEEKTYRIPLDNPFPLEVDIIPEIYAYGFRNPWSLTLSQDESSLFVGDVGYETYEKVVIVEKGGNYGWNILEGTYVTPWGNRKARRKVIKEAIPSIFEYPHRPNGPSSVIGGYYISYENEYYPEGYYLADYIGPVVRISSEGEEEWQVVDRWDVEEGMSIYSWGMDNIGRLFITGVDKKNKGYLRLINSF